MSRTLWLLTGGVWAARSLLAFANPDYREPVTAIDWTAVWLFSVCWLLFAPSVFLLGRLASSRQVMTVAAVLAIGAFVAGAANAIEDGLGVKAWGTLYVVGSLTAWLGLLALAATFHRARYSRLAGLAVVLFVGVLLFNAGGGLLVLGGLGALTIAPAWFARPGQVVKTDMSAEGDDGQIYGG